MPIQVTSKHAGSVTSASDNSDTLKIIQKDEQKEFRNGDGVLEGIFQTLESNFSTRQNRLLDQSNQSTSSNIKIFKEKRKYKVNHPLKTSKY